MLRRGHVTHGEDIIRFNGSHETQALVAACRAGVPGRPDVTRLDATDWPRLIDRAERLGVAGHLRAFARAPRISERVPAAALDRLDAVYYRQAARNTLLHAAARDLLEALEARGVRGVVLKGTALAATAYRNVAMRPMRDVDLLVHESDVTVAEGVLHALDYVSDESFRSRSWYVERHHHLPPFVARKGPAVIEIHWKLAPPYVPVVVPIDELWDRARPVRIGGTPALMLAPDDLVFHMSLHLAGSDGFVGKLGELCDIAEVVRDSGTGLEWARLCDTAHGSGGAGHCYYALWLVRTLLDARVPDGVLDALDLAARREPFVDRAIKAFARWAASRTGTAGRPVGAGTLQAWGRALLHRPTWRDRLLEVARTL